jgi:hypothetical protein
MSTPLKMPIELIRWKRWDSPKRNLIPDPASGDYHNWSRTPLQRPYLGRRRSTHEYTQVSLCTNSAGLAKVFHRILQCYGSEMWIFPSWIHGVKKAADSGSATLVHCVP